MEIVAGDPYDVKLGETMDLLKASDLFVKDEELDCVIVRWGSSAGMIVAAACVLVEIGFTSSDDVIEAVGGETCSAIACPRCGTGMAILFPMRLGVEDASERVDVMPGAIGKVSCFAVGTTTGVAVNAPRA